MKKTAEQRLILRKGDHTISDISWWQYAVLTAQPAGTAAIIGDRHNSGQIGNRVLVAIQQLRRYIRLQATQNSGKSGPTPKRNDSRRGLRLYVVFCQRTCGARTRLPFAIGIQQFGKARILLQKREVFVISGVIPVFRPQLNRDL